MQYFVEISRFAICGIIINICGFAIYELAVLRNLRICDSGMSPRIYEFSSPFFSVELLYDYEFSVATTTGN
jgi:hypothetical protein